MGPGRHRWVRRDIALASASTALTLVYSAPTPGRGSRYSDWVDGGTRRQNTAHETRLLSAFALLEVLSDPDEKSVGEVVSRAVELSLARCGAADVRAAAYLAPLLRAGLSGVPVKSVLDALGADEIPRFLRAFEAAGEAGRLREAFGIAQAARGDATLRDAMRFASGRDPLARDYSADYEVPEELARPAILAALSHGDSARAAVVQGYLETLAEVPDPDISDRAGSRESEEVSRMARGAIKAGGAHTRRGLEAIANLDHIIREDPRLSPTGTEPLIVAATYIVCTEHGPQSLAHRIRPTTYRNRGR